MALKRNTDLVVRNGYKNSWKHGFLREQKISQEYLFVFVLKDPFSYMNERVPGIHIPDDLIKRVAAAGDDKERISDISIDIAAATIRELDGACGGVHVMAIGWEDKIPAILERSGLTT